LARAPTYSNAEGIAFYGTQDADSEGEEGKFFVWTPDEIREVLGSCADEFMVRLQSHAPRQCFDRLSTGRFDRLNTWL
jgi:uncharacterized protein YyaL (SSP411 family)